MERADPVDRMRIGSVHDRTANFFGEATDSALQVGRNVQRTRLERVRRIAPNIGLDRVAVSEWVRKHNISAVCVYKLMQVGVEPCCPLELRILHAKDQNVFLLLRTNLDTGEYAEGLGVAIEFGEARSGNKPAVIGKYEGIEAGRAGVLDQFAFAGHAAPGSFLRVNMEVYFHNGLYIRASTATHILCRIEHQHTPFGAPLPNIFRKTGHSKYHIVFPIIGKNATPFSNHWKTRAWFSTAKAAGPHRVCSPCAQGHTRRAIVTCPATRGRWRSRSIRR